MDAYTFAKSSNLVPLVKAIKKSVEQSAMPKNTFLLLIRTLF